MSTSGAIDQDSCVHTPLTSSDPGGSRNTGHVAAVEEWLAVWVKSNFEKSVSQSIRARGITEFLPTCIKRTRRSRGEDLQEPLFPGYVFCHLAPTQRATVLRIPGVVNFVGVGKWPLAVDEQEIEAIRRMVTLSSTVCEWPYTQTGLQVLINKGPLAGIKGVVIASKNTARIVVSISLLKRSLAAEIDAECLTKL